MKNRIWELDAARGICIAGMVLVHLVYDLTVLFPVFPQVEAPLYLLIKDWGSVFFFLISGISVTLGSRPVKRGLAVFGCGTLCSLVTYVLAALGFGEAVRIRFGVLHCLGCCMVLWPVFRKTSAPLLAATGTVTVAIGLYFRYCLQTDVPYLYPLGLCRADFSSADYFPVLPYLGFFLLGAVLGKTIYRSRQSLLPGVCAAQPVIRFFLRCGQMSLPIYLFHQPVLALFAGTLFLIRRSL